MKTPKKDPYADLMKDHKKPQPTKREVQEAADLSNQAIRFIGCAWLTMVASDLEDGNHHDRESYLLKFMDFDTNNDPDHVAAMTYMITALSVLPLRQAWYYPNYNGYVFELKDELAITYQDSTKWEIGQIEKRCEECGMPLRIGNPKQVIEMKCACQFGGKVNVVNEGDDPDDLDDPDE